MDSFIPCLTVRKSEIYRHFIEPDEITTLQHPETSAGKLHYDFTCQEDRDKRYYKVVGRGRYNKKAYIRNFGEYTYQFKAAVTKLIRESGDVIVIVKFADHNLTQPVFLEADDWLLQELKSFHSEPLRKLVESYALDDLAPKESGVDDIPRAIVEEESDDEDAAENVSAESDDSGEDESSEDD